MTGKVKIRMRDINFFMLKLEIDVFDFRASVSENHKYQEIVKNPSSYSWHLPFQSKKWKIFVSIRKFDDQ